jgi:hypothetical protein
MTMPITAVASTIKDPNVMAVIFSAFLTDDFIVTLFDEMVTTAIVPVRYLPIYYFVFQFSINVTPRHNRFKFSLDRFCSRLAVYFTKIIELRCLTKFLGIIFI